MIFLRLIAHDTKHIYERRLSALCGLNNNIAHREFDHLSPFVGFLGDELAKRGRRAGKHRRAEVVKFLDPLL